MKRLFFESKYDEICHDESYFQCQMKYEKLKEINVFKAEPYKEKGIFWCSEYSFYGDGTDEYCGKKNGCDEYEPRNRKNGRCKFHSVNLYTHGDEIILKYKPSKILKH